MDDFEFSPKLREFFGATSGAGSRVTEKDEAKKRQLTLPKNGFERKLVTSMYQNIPVGAKRELGDACMFEFRIYPSGERIKLPLLFRPNDNEGGRIRDELRMYMHQGIFRPAVGLMWFVYLRHSELWLGALTDAEIQAIESGIELDTQDGLIDLSEELFQEAINEGKLPKLKTTILTAFQRDPSVAIKALESSGYTCEIFPEYRVFSSRISGKPYLEAHHVVPMFWQRHIPDKSLDVAENICILNPYSHKMIHHARFDEIEIHIKSLANKRAAFLRSLGLNVDNLLKIYSGSGQ